MGFREVLNEALGLVEIDERSKPMRTREVELNDQSDDGLEFRLFASGPSTTAKIRVKSPDVSQQIFGFRVPERPRGFYFKDTPTVEEAAILEGSAISGAQILELSKTSWPGCFLPWRIQWVTPNGGKVLKRPLLGHGTKELVEPTTRSRRTKPGKKTRVAMRKKATLRAKEQSILAEKEAALRAKKLEKNKRKKTKRKEKKRNDKLAEIENPP
jgi:hypothetical protein